MYCHLKAVRRDSNCNLTCYDASNLSCRQIQCCNSFRVAVARHVNATYRVCDRRGRNKIVRVGEKSGHVLSHLWTNVREMFGQCRRPFVLFSALIPGCVCHVSFIRYSLLSVKVVEKPNKCNSFLFLTHWLYDLLSCESRPWKVVWLFTSRAVPPQKVVRLWPGQLNRFRCPCTDQYSFFLSLSFFIYLPSNRYKSVDWI